MRAFAASGFILTAVIIVGACGSDDGGGGDGSSSGTSGTTDDGGRVDGKAPSCPDGQGACNGACAALSVTDGACGAA